MCAVVGRHQKQELIGYGDWKGFFLFIFLAKYLMIFFRFWSSLFEKGGKYKIFMIHTTFYTLCNRRFPPFLSNSTSHIVVVFLKSWASSTPLTTSQHFTLYYILHTPCQNWGFSRNFSPYYLSLVLLYDFFPNLFYGAVVKYNVDWAVWKNGHWC